MKAVPVADFVLRAGEDRLAIRNKYIAEHFFCSILRVYTHHRRRRDPTQYSINIECLDNEPIPTVPGSDGEWLRA